MCPPALPARRRGGGGITRAFKWACEEMGQRSTLTHLTVFFSHPHVKLGTKKQLFSLELRYKFTQFKFKFGNSTNADNNSSSSSNIQSKRHQKIFLHDSHPSKQPGSSPGFMPPVINVQNTALIAALVNGNGPLIGSSHQHGTRSTISNYQECLPAISAPHFLCFAFRHEAPGHYSLKTCHVEHINKQINRNNKNHKKKKTFAQ